VADTTVLVPLIARLDDLERRLLIELVQFWLQDGIKSPQYLDPETGGLYEHKLAARIGEPSPTADGLTPPEVVAACQALAEKGLVTRNPRRPDFQVMGIRPTQAGIALVRYWDMAWHRKALSWARNNWPSWALPIALTILTQLVLQWLRLSN
jgi:hypothetical protein